MRTLGVLLFPEFELLDVFGPLEMFGMLPEDFTIRLVAERERSVASAQGPRSVADTLFADDGPYDILLVPGGRGTRREVGNSALLAWLRDKAATASLVTSVCTGSALLAQAGLLDGIRATTNKMAFAWVRSQGPQVLWQPQARWVEDGKFATSSGVSAGIDMSLAVIARLCGEARARQVALWAEYEWHDDPQWDPFAARHGLV
ncbi:DJ-1/PfpI family protein [Hypericibacter sp.]|uniref:DJ-1/PfpI family protein n=1 Tax=Hypericibacter sp. TaxID=2705401 RepID=UPI003D6D4B0C